MRKQQGMTLIGMLLVLATVVIMGVIIMKVVPVYLQHYSVTSAIRSLNEMPPSDFGFNPASNVNLIKKKVSKQLYVNGVDDMVGDGITVKPLGQYTYLIMVKYQVIKPLFYNISFLFNFEDTEEVNIGKH